MKISPIESYIRLVIILGAGILVSYLSRSVTAQSSNSNRNNSHSKSFETQLKNRKNRNNNAISTNLKLRTLLQQHNITVPDAGTTHTPERIKLGQALFFDRELSGNRDTSCATCHHPERVTGDALALPVGTGPENPGAFGIDRIMGADRAFVPRNAPEIFSRGSLDFKTMFWDSRVAELPDGSFASPAGDKLLPGLTSALYIQAMFPVTSNDEMRGRPGDLTFDGEINEIALIDERDLHAIWSALMDRLAAIPEYPEMFEAAYPGTRFEEMTFAHAANAIGAFEIGAMTFLDSPFDDYLEGDDEALSDQQKRGALLFYGKANCVGCHSGALMTDQKHWSLAVPQLGPGKGDFSPRDLGRYLINNDFRDLFAFRTPPLRNVAVTGPYMHNGAYRDLKSAIRQHSSPFFSLLLYRPERQLEQVDLIDSVLSDWSTRFWLLFSLDAQKLPGYLRRQEVEDLESFLNCLTAPDLDSRLEATIPDSVPSGLPVER